MPETSDSTELHTRPLEIKDLGNYYFQILGTREQIRQILEGIRQRRTPSSISEAQINSVVERKDTAQLNFNTFRFIVFPGPIYKVEAFINGGPKLRSEYGPQLAECIQEVSRGI